MNTNVNTNIKKILFGNSRQKRPPALLAVTPPRTGERTLLGVENLLQSIAVPEPFSLELAGDMDGVTLMARCQDDQVVRGQLAAHYPQARIREVPVDEDPIFVHVGEQAWGMTLRAGGPEYVPLRTFRDDDLLDPGSDPLIALMGALSELEEGERVLCRLLLRSLGPDWSQGHQARAHRQAVPDNREPSYTYQTKPLQLDGVTMAVLGAGALAAEEAAALIRQLFTADGPVTFEGQYYQLDEAPLSPRSFDAPIPLMIGGTGPKRTLRTLAMYGDVFNLDGFARRGMSVELLREKREILERHCERVGRDPDEIRITMLVPTKLTNDQAEADEFIERIGPKTVAGSADYIAQRLGEFAAEGVDEVMFGRLPNTVEDFQRFEEEVIAQFD